MATSLSLFFGKTSIEKEVTAFNMVLPYMFTVTMKFSINKQIDRDVSMQITSSNGKLFFKGSSSVVYQLFKETFNCIG